MEEGFFSVMLNFFISNFDVFNSKKVQLFDVCKCCKIMKIPLARIVGPMLRYFDKEFWFLCDHDLFGGIFYVRCLALFGMALNIYDIYNIRNGTIVRSFWSRNMKKENYNEMSRDCKLTISVVSLEHHLFLLLATFSENSILFMPYLLVHGIVFIGDLLITFGKILFDRESVNCRDIVVIAFIIHNWLHVFCLFRRKLNKCDY